MSMHGRHTSILQWSRKTWKVVDLDSFCFHLDKRCQYFRLHVHNSMEGISNTNVESLSSWRGLPPLWECFFSRTGMPCNCNNFEPPFISEPTYPFASRLLRERSEWPPGGTKVSLDKRLLFLRGAWSCFKLSDSCRCRRLGLRVDARCAPKCVVSGENMIDSKEEVEQRTREIVGAKVARSFRR